MRVLVTGGAGYIGSHTVLELLSNGYEVGVLDNFANSSPEALRRVRALANGDVAVYESDVRDAEAVTRVCTDFRPAAVVHFAGLKAVGESTEHPLRYYETNVGGTLNLLRGMETAGCDRIIFSSSATVYGDPDYLPYDEGHPTRPESPYGRTKLMAEHILRDWAAADGRRSAIILRYFNPVGAHRSGRIGEDPRDIPNNLMPILAQVAVGRRDKLMIYGDDYPTRDGTGERDYIHVTDLANAHAAALAFASKVTGTEIFNIGTGTAYSVRDMLRAFSAACGRELPFEVAARRPGDIAAMLANPARARSMLGWSASLGLDDMVTSTWAWQSENPEGYPE